MLLVLLSFFVFLPMIILRPSKFAITFSLGSMLILMSLGFLRGWKSMVQGMVERERIGPSALYVGSLVGTLWASLVAKSYLLSIGMVGVQVAMLTYYVVSLVPGGRGGGCGCWPEGRLGWRRKPWLDDRMAGWSVRW